MLSRYRSGDPQPAEITSLVVVRQVFWAGVADTVEHLRDGGRSRLRRDFDEIQDVKVTKDMLDLAKHIVN
jgi:hypothetical protein